MQRITNNLDHIESAANDFLNQYADIAFLWEKDLESSFQEFLNQGTDVRELFLLELKKREDLEEEQVELEIENFDAMALKIMDGCTTKQPSLEVFDSEITKLYEYKARIAGMEHSADIGWLKVNAQPLIKELQTIINSWIDRFTSYLYQNTTYQLTNIKGFITEVQNGIKVLPAD